MVDLQQQTFWIFDMDGTLTVPAHDFSEARRALNIGAEEDILAALSVRSPQEQEAAAQWLAAWGIDIALVLGGSKMRCVCWRV